MENINENNESNLGYLTIRGTDLKIMPFHILQYIKQTKLIAFYLLSLWNLMFVNIFWSKDK